MLGRLEIVEERGKQERLCEAWVAAAVDVPRSELSIAPARDDGRPDGLPSFRVRVEHDGRPVGSRASARNEVGDGNGVLRHDGLVLGCERRSRPGVGSSPDAHARVAAR